MLRSAVFNKERTHRFVLSRIWDDKFSKILFIGLNPSTADGLEDDATVRRLINFAKDWGYGGFYLCNLFSFIATEQEDLKAWYDPLSHGQEIKALKENILYLKRYKKICSTHVKCWGAGAFPSDTQFRIHRLFPDAQCFGHTKDRHPKHPLYLASDTQLIPFK